MFSRFTKPSLAIRVVKGHVTVASKSHWSHLSAPCLLHPFLSPSSLEFLQSSTNPARTSRASLFSPSRAAAAPFHQEKVLFLMLGEAAPRRRAWLVAAMAHAMTFSFTSALPSHPVPSAMPGTLRGGGGGLEAPRRWSPPLAITVGAPCFLWGYDTAVFPHPKLKIS